LAAVVHLIGLFCSILSKLNYAHEPNAIQV